MNFLNSVCGIYGRAVLWCSPCCRDSLKICTYLPSLTSRSTRDTSRTGLHEHPQTKLCKGNLLVVSRPMLWNQVRYKDTFPRFHRDLDFPNFDAYRKDEFIDVTKTSWGQGDKKGGISYFISFIGLIGTMYGAKSHITHYMTYMSAAADVRAMASIEVDISKVAPGGFMSLKWRGKPLFIKNRTQVDIDNESKTPMSALKDPQTEEQRTIKPEWLIVIGICTHLGCVPIPNSGDWPGGFYCPCHGSHYDNIGRARKGPAPTNLEVPPYKFLTDTTVLVG